MWQRLPDEPTEALSGGAMVAPAYEAAPAAEELAHDGDRALAHDTTRLADRYAAFCATLQACRACAARCAAPPTHDASHRAAPRTRLDPLTPHRAPRRSGPATRGRARLRTPAPAGVPAAPLAIERSIDHATIRTIRRRRPVRGVPRPLLPRSIDYTRAGHASLGTPSAIICSVRTLPTPLPSSITSARYAQPRDIYALTIRRREYSAERAPPEYYAPAASRLHLR